MVHISYFRSDAHRHIDRIYRGRKKQQTAQSRQTAKSDIQQNETTNSKKLAQREVVRNRLGLASRFILSYNLDNFSHVGHVFLDSRQDVVRTSACRSHGI